MKIALVSTWFPPKIVGSGNRFYEIGKRLSSRHEIHVYTVGIPGCVDEEIMDGMHVHRYGVLKGSKSVEEGYHLQKLKFSYEVLKRLQKSVDLIDCNVVSKPLSYVSYFASGFASTPLIFTWHEVWYEQNFSKLGPILALPGFFMELFIPKLSNFNIAVSMTTKKRLVDLLHADPNNILVISNGVDLKLFKSISAKKKYGRILYVGRLESHKRVDTLLYAYNELKKTYTEIELVIIGKGPQYNYLQNILNKLKLEDVRFCSQLPYEKLIEIMKSSWILVLPSIMEGQGIVLLEAMAAGTPPIAIQSKGSAVGDVVLNNNNGLLVPQCELGFAIERLLTDKNLYESLRTNGLKYVEDYDWDKITEKTEKVYEILAGVQ